MPGPLESQGAAAARIEFDSFLPADRRRALLSGDDLPPRNFGAALFVDLSGFTALTDRLVAEHGPRRGAERLSQELGTMFDVAVKAVHRHRGSVVGFAGDAITCWFPGNDGVLGAVAAATEAQAQAIRPVKLVVTSGYASRFLVGDPEIQVLEVLAGAVVDRLGVAEQLAHTGEVLVGSGVLGWLGDKAEFEWRRDELALADRRIPEGESFAVIRSHTLAAPPPDPDWPASGIDPEIAGRWIPPSVYSRIARGEEAFLSELRTVSTVFIRFGGIDFETDLQAAAKLDAFVRGVQRIVHDLGGHLLEIIVGDKGSYLYAVFGATIAHEDDAQRAVTAARRIIAADHPATGIGAGVSEGVALCGLYGSSERRTYGALGKPANEAARLMELAPVGVVLVSDNVAQSIAATYQVEPLDLPAGLSALQVTQRRTRLPAPGVATQVVGRPDVLARIDEWIKEAQAGRGRIGVVAGEPGMGKTRVMTELANRARAAGVSVAEGRGSALELNTAYYAWREVFADLLGFGDATVHDEVSVRLEPLVANTDFEDLLPLLNPVLPIELAPTERVSGLSTQGRGDLSLDLMLHCLEALRPGVVALDDGQWMDRASLHLVTMAAKNLPWMLTVVATRPSPPNTHESTPVFDLAGVADILHLGVLSDDDILEVVRLQLGVEAVPPELGALLVSRSDGNPFYAEELARSLTQAGLITVASGKALVQGSLRELGATVPESVITRVQARLSSLPQELQTTVTVACLLGEEFDLDLLADVHPTITDASQLVNQLDRLKEAGVISSDDDANRYRFSHTLVREAVVALPVTETARQIHTRAAEWIERTHSDLSTWHSILAYHWEGAEVAKKAVGYHATAAHRALSSGAYDEAVSGFRRALDLYEADQSLASTLDAASWHMLLGEARVFQQGEDERQAREDLVRGLELIGEGPPRVLPTPVAIVGSLVAQIRNRWLGRRAAQDPEQVEKLRLAARAYEQLVEVYFLANEDLASLHASFRTLNLAERAGAPAELARGFATVGALVGLIPQPKLADRYLDRAEEAAATADDVRARMWVSLVRGFYYAGIGRWDVAEAASSKGRDLAEDLGDRRRLEDGLAALMVEKWFQGDLVEAEEYANEIRGLAQKRRARRSQAYAAQGRAYVYVEMGDTANAGAAIDELERLGYNVSVESGTRRPDDEALASDTLALRSLTHMRAGRFEQAVTDARQLVERMQGLRPFNFSAYMAYNAAAEVMVMTSTRGWGPHVTEQELTKAVKLAEAYAKIFPIGKPRPLLWKGMLKAKRGEASAASDLREAAATAHSLRMSLDEARALFELGRLGLEGTAQAAAITAAKKAGGVAASHGSP